MSLVGRLKKLEKTVNLVEETVTFLGWKDCEWKRAEGLNRMEGESKAEFFKRVRLVTNKKWIWCE